MPLGALGRAKKYHLCTYEKGNLEYFNISGNLLSFQELDEEGNTLVVAMQVVAAGLDD